MNSLCSEIKSKIRLTEYIKKELNITIKGGRGVSCIEKGTNETACIYNDSYFHDFKTNISGSVIDLVAHTKFSGNIGEAIRYLADYCNIEKDYNPEWLKYTQNLCNTVQKWHEGLSEEHKKYLKARKVSAETITRLKLGTNEESRLVIPYFKNSYVSYYITRGEDPKYKKAFIDEYNDNIIWGLHTLNRNNKELYICEGAFDAICLDQEGFSVVSSMGGYFSKEQKENLKSICAIFDIVYTAFDTDDAGKLFLAAIAEFFLQNRVKFNVIKDLGRCKDVAEFFEKGGDLKSLAPNSVNGIQNMIKGEETEDELKVILLNVCKYLDRLELAKLISHLNTFECWNELWIKELIKQCQSCPSEDEISKKISSGHNLKYSEGLGFYEYQEGQWLPINETIIKSYIADELGRHRTGSKINTIKNLIEAENHFSDIFNMKSYINFANGTLDLESGKLLEHSPEFMLSHKVEYDYTPELSSLEWKKFILDVSGDDEQKALLLQETVGYILFPDNSLQKAFFLIGEGANGKSVFLNVISKLFDRKSVSNIEMCGLAESFQRIRLAQSVLNIASESHTSFEEGEMVFKQASVGDVVSGCYKNKDFVEFRPRTKFFTACNRFIQSRDTSEGFLRRICFIKFGIKFTEEPKSKSERKVDKDITLKLLSQLPAIFNWAYEGYKSLKAKKVFTELEEQKIVMNDYMKLIDPLFAFLSETVEDAVGNVLFLDRESLFSKYKAWCIDCNHHPTSKNKFLQSLRYTSSSRSIRVYEQGHKHERGFILEKVG